MKNIRYELFLVVFIMAVLPLAGFVFAEEGASEISVPSAEEVAELNDAPGIDSEEMDKIAEAFANPLSYLWLDVGGFGIGSDLTYQVIGTVGYLFDSGVRVFGGWRYFAFDYETEDGGLDKTLDLGYSGPVFGASYAF